MEIVVSGSLAYDRIMDFPGSFSDHILPEKIHVLNVSFTVSSLVEHLGGTAGNIAYALRLLGEEPTIAATIGRDYQRYFEWLSKNGISFDSIDIMDEEFTAGAYITTDRADNQITVFNPGAMKHPSSFDFDLVDPKKCIVIIAPGNLQDMATYSQDCKSRGIDYIFDPGQSLPMWDGEALARCIDGSRLLVSNDYELDLIESRTGLSRGELLARTGAIVTTLGEKGSTVQTPESTVDIPAIKSKGVVDPTGAGDAYRAGLIKGLIRSETLERSALMGSVCASFAIEQHGTQEYQFTMEEFNRRLDGAG